ncbi:MAG: zinc ribbon domain-containing protein [Euryarchaeota archaeon]|nr:zinc ribbon domain-containing protein [Euryarchaeota archaeon]MDE1836463.1 zinc ribbon domain-containing protein [Euryarchaeota archaeon]MDE1880630.1 zinc ribbon domain-containing protein [Euryarchaeota archaeon]MDE2044211.1 zinc ribbon domain-containing protein [Thermoplasmata archaeon]
MSQPPPSVPDPTNGGDGGNSSVPSSVQTRLVALNCPSCGAPLDPPGDTNRLECPFCGRSVLLDEFAVPEALRTPSLPDLDQRLYEAQSLGMEYYLAIVFLALRIAHYQSRLDATAVGAQGASLSQYERDCLKSEVAGALDAVWVRQYHLNAALARASRGATSMQVPPFPSSFPEDVSLRDSYRALATTVDFVRGILAFRRSVAIQLKRDPRAIDLAIRRCRDASSTIHGLIQGLERQPYRPSVPLDQLPLLEFAGPSTPHAVRLTPPPP